MSSSPAQVVSSKDRRRSGPVSRWCVVLTLFTVTVPVFLYYFVPSLSTASIKAARARLSSHASIKLSAGNNPTVRLSHGHDLLTAYVGPPGLTSALEQNRAEPLSLASADFDEDGVPDLVSGYAYDRRGIITVHRGNVDSIYPNAPDAKQRRANGTFTDAPFLSPARVLELEFEPELIAAGDFDADGHWDVIAARRDGSSLYLLAGDGYGALGNAREINLPGAVTAMATGDVNRRDGLTDIVVGLRSEDGKSSALVFEGPNGALWSEPEVLTLPSTATSIALGQLNGHYAVDIAIASGSELIVVEGRDRKLSLDLNERSAVRPARLQSRGLGFRVRSIAVGDFDEGRGNELAALSEGGEVHVVSAPVDAGGQTGKRRAGLGELRQSKVSPAPMAAADELMRVVASSGTRDDLLVREAGSRKLHLLVAGQSRAEGSEHNARHLISFDSEGEPVAILPMRLDPDALQDLVVARRGSSAPSTLFTVKEWLEPDGVQDMAQARRKSGQKAIEFSNTTPITIGATFSPPTAATPYPSTISVSGLPPSIDKLRVRLHGVSSSSPDMDLLLVGPTGQKVVLMSDVSTTCVISNQTLTFDDEVAAQLEGFNCVSGTYKPRDNDPAGDPDTFPTPAPAGPYQSTLSAFNGTDPNGTWSLYGVNDSNFAGPGQTIAGGWSLYFGPDMPLTFIVTNTNASGAGSLNQAVLDANAHLGLDIITFDIPDPGPFTINSSPPRIIEPVLIDATSQPGFSGTPLIEVRGTLSVDGGRASVRGLVINSFTGQGILIRRNSGNIIEGNYIGTNLNGTAGQSSQFADGIEIDTANNVIGGTAPPARNVISGNGRGIIFSSFFSTDDPHDNTIQGNFIGTNASGSAAIANTIGVDDRAATGTDNNSVGGTTAGARNVISGNLTGVASGNGDLVQGNYIGTDVNGTVTVSNGQGVRIEEPNSTIGGTTPAARNIIAGSSDGVFFRDPTTQLNLVQGNFIGTNKDGTGALPNSFGVRMIFDSAANTIGGATPGAGNVISGNTIAGVQLGEPTRGGALNNVVQGNFIGTDVTGNSALANGRTPFFDDAGIIIPANSRGDRIIENRIAFNRGHGIRITNVTGGDIDSIEIEIADNLIYGNQGLGIDLGNSGITPNDPQDADSGPNLLQNFPVLTSAVASAAGETIWERAGEMGREMPDPILAAALTINGTLNSTPNTNFSVHWYFSADAQCTTNQAASRPLAFGKVPNVITDGSGNAMFSIPFDFPSGIAGGIINCTATDPQGNTSEFSACFPVSTTPGPTPTPTPTPTPSPTPTPGGPMIFVETGTNDLAAVDSVSLVRGPFALTNTRNFSSDQRTRIIFFTTNLGIPQTFQPATNTLSVQVGGNLRPVESVGPNTTTGGSVIVFRLPDLPAGTHPLGIRLNGINSTNTPNLTIIASPSSPASAPKSNKAKLAEYLLSSLIDLIL